MIKVKCLSFTAALEVNAVSVYLSVCWFFITRFSVGFEFGVVVLRRPLMLFHA